MTPPITQVLHRMDPDTGGDILVVATGERDFLLKPFVVEQTIDVEVTTADVPGFRLIIKQSAYDSIRNPQELVEFIEFWLDQFLSNQSNKKEKQEHEPDHSNRP